MKRYITAIFYTWYIMAQSVVAPVFFNWYANEFNITSDQTKGIVAIAVIMNILQGILMIILWRSAILKTSLQDQFKNKY